jgi:uncharacterized membrane protein (DUF106 family)
MKPSVLDISFIILLPAIVGVSSFYGMPMLWALVLGIVGGGVISFLISLACDWKEVKTIYQKKLDEYDRENDK